MVASMRYAVFVDAGYLFAQSSKALAGETLQRDLDQVERSDMRKRFREVVRKRSRDT